MNPIIPALQGAALRATLVLLLVTGLEAMADGLPLANYTLNDFAGSANCGACHTSLIDQGGNDVSIDTHWRSTMMANSAKDPLWQAKVASEVRRNPALQDVIEAKCATCHTPIARTQANVLGAPVALTGGGFLDPTNAFHAPAMDGVSCSLCHQVRPDNLGTRDSFSGAYLIDTTTSAPDRLIYGPFSDPFAMQMRNNLGFTPVQGSHTTGSSLCAVCHNLYTPYVDSHGVVQGEFPEQMIYSEWEHSGYSGGLNSKECQDCHMPEADGGVVLSNRGGPGLNLPGRSPFGRHHFVGGNVFMIDLLRSHLDDLGISASTSQLADTRQRTLVQLQQQTAGLSVTGMRVSSSGLEVDLLVTNFAGHKFPSGFPSRRAWLHVTVADKSGTVFFESGKPLADGQIEGNDADAAPAACEPHYEIIQKSDQVQVYESVMEDTDGAVTYTLLRGAAYRKDNRLLPAGFHTATSPADIAVAGLAKNDPDFAGGADRITYKVNTAEWEGPFQLTAELLFQTVAWRFAQDLFQESDDAIDRFADYFTTADHTPVMLVASAVSVDPAQAYRLGIPRRLEDGTTLIPVVGPVGGILAVDGSSNLTDWVRVALVTQTNEVTLVNDAPAASALTRFYRLALP